MKAATLVAIALTLLAASHAAIAEDEEPGFGSTGYTVSSPPPPPAPGPKPRRRLMGKCPPGTKDEVCRCVVYDAADYSKSHFIVAVAPPPYCSDARLIAGAQLDESSYLAILYKVQTENGDEPHDGYEAWETPPS